MTEETVTEATIPVEVSEAPGKCTRQPVLTVVSRPKSPSNLTRTDPSTAEIVFPTTGNPEKTGTKCYCCNLVTLTLIHFSIFNFFVCSFCLFVLFVRFVCSFCLFVLLFVLFVRFVCSFCLFCLLLFSKLISAFFLQVCGSESCVFLYSFICKILYSTHFHKNLYII